MANETATVEVWILIDEDGNAVAHEDNAQLKERYETDIGELDGTKATRMVKITLTMPLPRPVELSAVIDAEPDGAVLSVA